MDKTAQTEELAHEQSVATWAAIITQLGVLAARLNKRSADIEGSANDPKMVSVLLFNRLFSHRNAFVSLFNDGYLLESEIICRSAVEVAICLINLNQRQEAFIADLRSDAALTLIRQLPVWLAEVGDLPKKKDEVEQLFGAKREDGKNHDIFRWKELAEGAANPEMYRWYKHLSASVTHVTGISIMQGAGLADDPCSELLARSWKRLRESTVLGFMCGACQFGFRAHCNTLGFADLEEGLAALMDRMAAAGQPV